MSLSLENESSKERQCWYPNLRCLSFMQTDKADRCLLQIPVPYFPLLCYPISEIDHCFWGRCSGKTSFPSYWDFIFKQ